MSSENEPAKLLLPYLQRADELQKHEPLVAYYCRLYAMELGLKIPQSDRTKTTNALLVSLMKQLEKDKKSLTLGPEDNLHLEGFALSVFAKADKQDRAGRADLNTAKTFYASSIFFEILNQFSQLQPDLEQKQKYAAWKAADIRKAIKEGRKPLSGPPGGDDDLRIPSSTSSSEYDLGTRTSDSAAGYDISRVDLAAKHVPDSDPSLQVHDQISFQQSTSNSSQPTNFVPMSPPSGIHPPPNYPTDNYSSSDIPHQQPSVNGSQHSIYHQSYHQEPQRHLPQPYPHEAAQFSYPNFQSYPSFTESSLPTAPTHQPSYYQGSEASYPNSSPSFAAPFPSTPEHNPSSRNWSAPEVSPPATQKYEYDSNYQPPPEKIAEAHKAARFAVGALAFDDVSVAVDFLKKSLELLTNPSAER